MIKITISTIFLLAAIQTAVAQGKFIFEGTADIEDGIVEVWRHEYECVRDSSDLIAKTEVRNGRFRVEVGEPGALVCRVYRTDKVGWWPVFLQPGRTTKSNMGNKGCGNMVFEGGENQRIFNDYLRLHQAAYERYKTVLSKYGNDLDKNFDEIRPRANVILKELVLSLDEFFIENRDKDVAAYVLYILSYGAEIGNSDINDLKAKYNILAEGPRNNAYGKRVAATIRKMESD